MTVSPVAWPRSSKPYTRWWWFNQPLSFDAIRAQLEWVSSQGFGGVEIAWVYASSRTGPWGPGWLSDEWTAYVVEAKRVADELGLGCDFTFGSLWPFGGSYLQDRPEDTSQSFHGPSGEQVRGSWEVLNVPVLNHLSEPALRRYDEWVGKALAPALAGSTSALFCDSWELDSQKLWAPELWSVFEERFGYDLKPLVDEGLERYPRARYDAWRLLSDTITRSFYQVFTSVCHQRGAISRVQCHGSPTDLLESYAAVDVPESETLLFAPSFSRIPASAAALSSKPVVSCETFTCLYGFPNIEIGNEFLPDLKLLADAVIAHGVNQIVWHGLAWFDPNDESRTHPFFASTHLGPDCAFRDELLAFNTYLATVCERMQRGRAVTKLAVYLPIEEGRLLGVLPRALRIPGATGYWELRTVVPPEETLPHQPLWISEPALRTAEFRDGRLYAGDAVFEALYVDVKWMDLEALEAILRLARQGLPVVWIQNPQDPGHQPAHQYGALCAELRKQSHVHASLRALHLQPLVEGRGCPPYWLRKDGDRHMLFLAHPDTRTIRYPMKRGQGAGARLAKRSLTIHLDGRDHSIDMQMLPCQSLLYEIGPDGPVLVPESAWRPREADTKLEQ